MEPVGEEEEEAEEEEPRPNPKRIDVEDEALYQKARVVTGNADLFGRTQDRETDHRDIQPTNGHFGVQPARKSSVQPAPTRRSIAASPPRKAMAPARMVPAAAPPRESKPGKQRVNLFETVAKTLSDALHMAQTPGGFYSPGQSIVLSVCDTS